MDMAVGIIIGAAFNKIVTSLVNDIIMPPIGLLLGGVDFINLEVILKYVIGDRVIYVNAVWQRIRSNKPVHSTSVTDSVGLGSTGHVP